jgi:hypothetical protein
VHGIREFTNIKTVWVQEAAQRATTASKSE